MSVRCWPHVGVFQLILLSVLVFTSMAYMSNTNPYVCTGLNSKHKKYAEYIEIGKKTES